LRSRSGVDAGDDERAIDIAKAVDERPGLAAIRHAAQLVDRHAAVGDLGIDGAGQRDRLFARAGILGGVARADLRRGGMAPARAARQLVKGKRLDREGEQAKREQHQTVS